MRSLFTILLGSLLCSHLHAQPDTEVFLSEMNFAENGFEFQNTLNISANPGYDNQPYFLSNDTLLFAKNQNQQTDIARYTISSKATAFMHPTTEGGEYSPQPIPGTKDIAAVRLDPDGKQRLYRYKAGEKPTQPLHPELEVAYFAFANGPEILASVLGLNQLDLVYLDLTTGNVHPIVTKSGRSIHRIPGSELLSYTVLNEDSNLDVYQFDPKSKESYFVCQLPIGVQDFVWYEDYKIIIGSGSQLFVYDLYDSGKWNQIADFSSEGITNITRLAISPNLRYISFAAENAKE